MKLYRGKKIVQIFQKKRKRKPKETVDFSSLKLYNIQ